jgi:signal transduction histidine kinase
MKYSLIIIVFAFIFFITGVESGSAESRATKRVLVLYSLEKGNIGQERVDAQLKDIFSRNKTFNIQIFNEYLDLIRFPEAKQISSLTDFLHQKYAKEKPDIILTVLPPALDCLEQHGRELFKGIPVVAAVLPRDRAESLSGSPLHKRATGIIYADNAYEIVESALKLMPETKHIAFVAGVSAIDISFKVSILKEIKRESGGMDLLDLSGLTIGETLSRVHTLPPDTIVFHTSIFKDKDGVTFNPPDVHRMVSNASNAPVFGFTETHIGKGIVGGRVASLQWQIDKLAELTQRVLSGEPPAKIPIVEEDGYKTLYDWKELKRWGILESSLPKGSILINKELNLFERYKLYIIVGLGFLLLQTVLIGYLIHINRRQKKVSSQLHNYEERFRELLRIDRYSRLGELTASLAHELNQPLTAILSTAQAALRFLESGEKDPVFYRELLQNIVKDDKRAANVIRSVRAMVKKEPLKKNKVNIAEILSEVIAITYGELIAHNITIESDIAAEENVVFADKNQIQQVLLNLILNALDAINHNVSVNREITLQTQNIDGFVRVSVHDTGPGITPEMVEQVFDPFFSTKESGIGMGLAVCKTIITEHEGRIWAVNNPQGGTTFSFELKVYEQ